MSEAPDEAAASKVDLEPEPDKLEGEAPAAKPEAKVEDAGGPEAKPEAKAEDAKADEAKAEGRAARPPAAGAQFEKPQAQRLMAGMLGHLNRAKRQLNEPEKKPAKARPVVDRVEVDLEAPAPKAPEARARAPEVAARTPAKKAKGSAGVLAAASESDRVVGLHGHKPSRAAPKPVQDERVGTPRGNRAQVPMALKQHLVEASRPVRRPERVIVEPPRARGKPEREAERRRLPDRRERAEPPAERWAARLPSPDPEEEARRRRKAAERAAEAERRATAKRLAEHYEHMTHFIRTKAEPTVFYLPAKHTKRTRQRLEDTRKAIDQKVYSLQVQGGLRRSRSRSPRRD